jgi:hypothetical protein
MGKLIRTLIAAFVLSLATGVSETTQAAEPERCALGGKYLVRSVAPYKTYEDAGYAAFTVFRGAEVFVPAQPGLTREWLQRVVSFQIAAGECDFGAPEVSVSVLSAGGGFSVRLSGSGEKEAREILNRAQQLQTK